MPSDAEVKQRHRREALTLPCKVIWWTLVALASVGYLARLYGEYDWRLGFASVLTFALGTTNAIGNIRRWHKLLRADRCPVCGGLLDQTERVVMESIWLADGAVPPIVDRMAKCESCSREHHEIAADERQLGALSHSPGLPTTQVFVGLDRALWEKNQAAWVANRPTHAQWESKLRSMQQEAEHKNRAQGMTWYDHWNRR